MGALDAIYDAFGGANNAINGAFGGGMNGGYNPFSNPMMNSLNGYGGYGGGGSYDPFQSMRNYQANIYGIDAGERQNTYNANTQKDIAGIHGGTQRDVANIGLEGSKYNADTMRDNNTLDNQTQRYGIDSTNQLGMANIGKDIYGIDTGYDIAGMNDATNRYKADTDRYGFDIGREVAGVKDRGDTQRTGIGAAASVLPDFLKDSQRRDVLGSPLMQSLLGNSFGGVMSGAMGAMTGKPGSAVGGSYHPDSPYDAKQVMGSLLDQINKPQVYNPTVAQFNPQQSYSPPPRTAVSPPPVQQAPIPQPALKAPVAPQAAPQAAPRQTGLPMHAGGIRIMPVQQVARTPQPIRTKVPPALW